MHKQGGVLAPRRVGGCAADAVIVCSEIIRRDIGADHNHRVGGVAADPTYLLAAKSCGVHDSAVHAFKQGVICPVASVNWTRGRRSRRPYGRGGQQ